MAALAAAAASDSAARACSQAVLRGHAGGVEVPIASVRSFIVARSTLREPQTFSGMEMILGMLELPQRKTTVVKGTRQSLGELDLLASSAERCDCTPPHCTRNSLTSASRPHQANRCHARRAQRLRRGSWPQACCPGLSGRPRHRETSKQRQAALAMICPRWARQLVSR